MSLPNFANQMLADTASSVRIACRTKMGLDYPLPEAYKTKIASTPHVVAVVPDIFFGGIYHEAMDRSWRRAYEEFGRCHHRLSGYLIWRS